MPPTVLAHAPAAALTLAGVAVLIAAAIGWLMLDRQQHVIDPRTSTTRPAWLTVHHSRWTLIWRRSLVGAILIALQAAVIWSYVDQNLSLLDR